METNSNIRNIAIIAHVDHGKTTLVDQMFKAGGVFRSGEEVAERVMDNLDLERERGITIAAKNCSVEWQGTKINIVDTPGHADFGGEVERSLMMVDGAILLVDASEGPLPQTRFVLSKALAAGLPIIVVVNKIDRKDARPAEVLDEIYQLFMDLDATDEQIEFPILYAIGRDGVAGKDKENLGKDLTPLFEAITKTVPPPRYDPSEPFQMLVTNLGYSEFLGKLAIGRIINGQVRAKEPLVRIGKESGVFPLRVVKVQVYQGARIVETELARAGEIVVLAGIEDAEIGDTICTKESPRALKRIVVDEPTIAMQFSQNTSPLAGREGKHLLMGKIEERLRKEALHNVALQIEFSKGDESITVKGRGEFQMVILIETMRREGFELTVGRPRIILREKDGKQVEPVERAYIDCEEQFTGVVTEKLSRRRGRLVNLNNHGSGRVRLEFSIPSRGLIGYRNEFLTDTRGTGIINSILEGYEEYRGDFMSRLTGSLVSDRHGISIPYALFHLEPRGILFVPPGEEVYKGMIIGEHSRDNDLHVNPCKTKKLTNIRAAGRDENVVLTPVAPMTVEKALDFIKDDELIEVTPVRIRMRKAVL
jgi:GTP-binding protein